MTDRNPMTLTARYIAVHVLILGRDPGETRQYVPLVEGLTFHMCELRSEGFDER